MYEYGTVKPVEAILKSRREKRKGMKLGYLVHMYGNVITIAPVQLLHANKNIKNESYVTLYKIGLWKFSIILN
jgi:hypothetical protein